MLTFIATAANIGFLVVFTATHSPFWKGSDWLLVILFPLFGVGFPLLLEFLFKRQRLNLALRIAWSDLEDLVFEHVSGMCHWYRCTISKSGAAPGYGVFYELSEEFREDMEEALSVLPVIMRLEMRRDLEKLQVTRFLWARLEEGKHQESLPYGDELIYREMHRRYTLRLRPDLTHTIIAVLIANLVGWWLMW